MDAATIAALLTAGGAPIGAGIVTGIIEFLKRLAPNEGRWRVAGREKLLALVIATLIVAYAALTGASMNPPTVQLSPLFLPTALLAIYNIARLSMGIHDDLTRKDGSLTEVSEKQQAKERASLRDGIPATLPDGLPPAEPFDPNAPIATDDPPPASPQTPA